MSNKGTSEKVRHELRVWKFQCRV